METYELLQKLREAVAELALAVPRLLAVYAHGDRLHGRALWSSPLELAFILDVDTPTPGRILRNQPLLPPAQLEQLQIQMGEVLAGIPRRYRLAKLEQRQDRMSFHRVRNEWELIYYEIAQGVLHGQRIYAAPDFLLEDFEAAVRAEWVEDNAVWQRAQEKLQGQFASLELSTPTIVPLPRLDVAWLAEFLPIYQHTLKYLHSSNRLKPEALLRTLNYRQRLRTEWHNLSEQTRSSARHLVSTCTRQNPQNYTQLAAGLADLDIIAYAAVPLISRICERRASTQPTPHNYAEDVELLSLLPEHLDAAEHYAQGILRFLHHQFTLLEEG